MTVIEITRGDQGYCRVAVSLAQAGKTTHVGSAVNRPPGPWEVWLGHEMYLTHSHTRAVSRLIEAAHDLANGEQTRPENCSPNGP